MRRTFRGSAWDKLEWSGGGTAAWCLLDVSRKKMVFKCSFFGFSTMVLFASFVFHFIGKHQGMLTIRMSKHFQTGSLVVANGCCNRFHPEYSSNIQPKKGKSVDCNRLFKSNLKSVFRPRDQSGREVGRQLELEKGIFLKIVIK